VGFREAVSEAASILMESEGSSTLELYTELDSVEKDWSDWFETSRKIVKRYRNEKEGSRTGEDASPRFQILWSNVQILTPALYARTPKPEITIRNRGNKDFLSRTTGYVWEAGVNYLIDDFDYDLAQLQKILDYLLVGRGVSRVRYDPSFSSIEDPQTGAMVEVKSADSSKIEYIYFEDFLHSEARIWSEVDWVAFRHFYSKEDANSLFGEEVVKEMSFNSAPNDLDDKIRAQLKKNKAIVWEVWDKRTKTVKYISPHLRSKVLKEVPDPLGLKDFFPCGTPLYATLTNDSLKPVADYLLYQDQALQLDAICGRMASLTSYIKFAGAHDGAVPELSKILQQKDGNFVAVKNWSQFKGDGGIEGAMSFVPLKEAIEALEQLSVQKGALIQDIYEITGISDLVRGSTNPYEAAKTQQLKGQFANLRMSSRQTAVQKSNRDDIANLAEVFAEKFSPESVRAMSGYDYLQGSNPQDPSEFQAIYGLLQQEPLRDYSITVQTDSTLAFDTQAHREQLNLYLENVTGFVDKATQFCTTAPELVPYFKETLKFVSNSYNIGRGLEAILDSSFDALAKRLANPPEPPPDPKMVEIQNNFEIEKLKIELETARLELEREKVASDLASKKYRVDQTTNINQQKLEIQLMDINQKLEAEKIKLAQEVEKFNAQMLQAEVQHRSQMQVQMQPKEEKEPQEKEPPVVVNVQKGGGWKMQRGEDGLIDTVLPIE